MDLITIAFIALLVLAALLLLPAITGFRWGRQAPAARWRCGQCAHWDLEEGQATMQQYPTFLQAARHLPPAKMGRTVQYEPRPCTAIGCGPDAPNLDCKVCHGNGTTHHRIDPEPSHIPLKTKWSDFGACMKHEQLCHADDHCSDFVQLRRRA